MDLFQASRGSKGRTRLAFTRGIPGLKSETSGTLRVSRVKWVWGSQGLGFGFRVFRGRVWPSRVRLHSRVR